MRRAIIAAMAAALLVAACSTPVPIDPTIVAPVTTTTEAEHVDDDTIHVSLSEFVISDFELVDGEEYTFTVTNDGAVAHELRFVTPEDVMAHEHEEGHGDEAGAPVIALEPGETGTLTIVYDAAYFQAACLLPGHYDAGMFVTLSEGSMDMDMGHDDDDHEG